MMEISNKTITFLLIAAIAISLFGTFLSLVKITGWAPSITGFGVTDTGEGMVNLTIDRVVDINWTVTNITWGEGSITPGFENCSMYNNGSANIGCTGFSDYDGKPSPLIIENIGNVNTTLNLSFDVNASTLFPGTASPAFYFMVNETEHGSCTNTTGEEGTDARYDSSWIWFSTAGQELANNTPDDWVTVNKSAEEEFMICPRFDFTDTNDSLNVWIYVTVPLESPAGNASATITASASLMDPYGS